MAKIEPFEKYCDEYDKWFENNSAIFETELEALRELIPFPEAEGIEIGVGSGKFAAPLGIKIGLDPSEKMANKARKKA
jgi:ubiquinone/menaquinone biosynthesis C-methylase UbiE